MELRRDSLRLRGHALVLQSHEPANGSVQPRPDAPCRSAAADSIKTSDTARKQAELHYQKQIQRLEQEYGEGKMSTVEVRRDGDRSQGAG